MNLRVRIGIFTAMCCIAAGTPEEKVTPMHVQVTVEAEVERSAGGVRRITLADPI